jgi:hypothetical protein
MFGKLMHPILDALDNTPHEWIRKLLFTFNEGNIGMFEALSPVFPKEVISAASYAWAALIGYLTDSLSCKRIMPSSDRRFA